MYVYERINDGKMYMYERKNERIKERKEAESPVPTTMQRIGVGD